MRNISTALLCLLVAACSLHGNSSPRNLQPTAPEQHHSGLVHGEATLTATAGDTLDVPIVVEGIQSVKAFGFSVTYPSSALSIKYADGQAFKVTGTESQATDGSTTVRVAGSAAEQIVHPSMLATLHFEVNPTASGQIQLSLADLAGDIANASPALTKISITASAAAAAPVTDDTNLVQDNRAAATRLAVFETGMSAPPSSVVMQFQGILKTLDPYCTDSPGELANSIIANVQKLGVAGDIPALSDLIQSTLLRIAASGGTATSCAAVMASVAR